MMEKSIRKIEYIKKSRIDLTQNNIAPEAKLKIEQAGENDILALRVRVNSPVFIEAAALLTAEGIKEVCSI